MENNKIIHKIKKLLALAEGADSNEAAMSLQKARTLMNKHGITSTQLAIKEIGEHPGNKGKYKTPPDYIVFLASTCADLFQCALFWVTDYKVSSHTTYPVFVGKSPAEEICAYTYNVLEAKLKKARKDYQPFLLSRLSKTTITHKKNAYALGWVAAIASKVKDMVPPAPKETIVPGVGLMPVNPLDVYVKSKVGEEKGTPRSTPITRLDALQGREDGSKVSINKGMTNSSAKLLD